MPAALLLVVAEGVDQASEIQLRETLILEKDQTGNSVRLVFGLAVAIILFLLPAADAKRMLVRQKGRSCNHLKSAAGPFEEALTSLPTASRKYGITA